MRLCDFPITEALRKGKKVGREADHGEWWLEKASKWYIVSHPHNKGETIVCMMLDDLTSDDWYILDDEDE